MFPARAGMSRNTKKQSLSSSRVPRASGDEPGLVVLPNGDVSCSPRERG